MKRSPVRTGALPPKGPAKSQYDLMQHRPKIVPHNGPIGYAHPRVDATAFKHVKPGVGAGSTITKDRKFDEIDRTPIRTWASARADEYTGPGRTKGAPNVSLHAERPGLTDPTAGRRGGRGPDQLKGRVMPTRGTVQRWKPDNAD
jgi:hypothetical protein